MHIARYEKRIIAYFIDYGIAAVAAFAIFFLLPINLLLIEKILLSQIAAAVIYALLTFSFLTLTNGLTLGSMITRIRVVRLDDQKISARIALIRVAGLAIFAWALINALNMIIIHTERTIFDRLSDTLVIDKKCY